MSPKRRRSLLEDDDLNEIADKPAASSGDVCERCGHTRKKHQQGDVIEGPCSCGKCEEFVE